MLNHTRTWGQHIAIKEKNLENTQPQKRHGQKVDASRKCPAVTRQWKANGDNRFNKFPAWSHNKKAELRTDSSLVLLFGWWGKFQFVSGAFLETAAILKILSRKVIANKTYGRGTQNKIGECFVERYRGVGACSLLLTTTTPQSGVNRKLFAVKHFTVALNLVPNKTNFGGLGAFRGLYDVESESGGFCEISWTKNISCYGGKMKKIEKILASHFVAHFCRKKNSRKENVLQTIQQVHGCISL